MKKIVSSLLHYWQFALTIVVGIVALIMAFVLSQSDEAGWLISGYAIFISLFLFWSMIQTLREGRYGVDILAITAIVATIAVGQYWASLVIVAMLTGGETLENFAANRARRELSALLERAPTMAHVLRGSEVIDVKISVVKPGDIVVVRPHEVVPVDGELISDSAEFDESSLTGESLPVRKKQGETVMSGALNGEMAVHIRATADAKHSQYEQIIQLVREAENQPAPFVRLADRYAIPFTIISYVIAGTAWAISGEASRFAEVLVVASPCPLILAAPIALISGMSRASKHGIIVKNGAVLEKLNSATIFAFDKTGTLTHGDVVVSEVVAENNFDEGEIIGLAASAEIDSAHILATSLVNYAKKRHLKITRAKNVREITGDGVFATVGSKKIIVGRAEFLRKNKVTIPATDTSSTAIFVAINNQFAGAIYFADQVRAESKKTLHELKQTGIRMTVMLTGDRQATAEKIAKAAGVDEVFAELLPKDKVQIMRKFHNQKDGVVMVGDGINDAPVLAAADVGIAMGARGSTAASESADAVIMLDDLGRVALLRKISKRTIKVALQSVWTGIGLCLVLMVIAAFGYIPALVGAGLQEVIDVVVIFNALRAHRG
ncbi:MAG: cadmium-translocating P-type ATPase [Candidatus Nomurabacteria bacterium]|jgi:heavy metal translocating P-type ATPase|nr:cadmium-translocating P-type ATPase [Candidatus Nomurabacteria bacterium]